MFDQDRKTPPKGRGALAKREAKLAYGMLVPTFLIVLSIILFPLLANFWISFKPVELADLRPARVIVQETVRPRVSEPDIEVGLRYRLRNSSQKEDITAVTLMDRFPAGMTILGNAPENCDIIRDQLSCDFGDLPAKGRIEFTIPVSVNQEYIDRGTRPRDTEPVTTGQSPNVLTSFEFTLDNFRKIFNGSEFWTVLRVSLYYTIFGTLGALVLGLFAAQLLNTSFNGRNVLRGLFLFPYVAPVIAVAFAWVLLLDAGPGGTFNAILMRMGVMEGPINFLGQRYVEFGFLGLTIKFPLALTTVIAFEAWRYFPLSFLFILARMQSIGTDMFEAAEIDGATPFQQFWFLALPQLMGILAVLFLLRFIWTFNKFDDIFLLTGGAAGTRTLTVDVYEQAFAVSNLGAGAAVAVIVFAVLLTFALFFFRLSPKDNA